MSKIRIETTFNSDEIRQTIHGHGCVEDQIIQSVIKLKDEGVRKALIELGWTPPVATPVPDYTGEGSAWIPPKAEDRRVVVPEPTSDEWRSIAESARSADMVDFLSGAAAYGLWLRGKIPCSIPADRVLGEGMVAVDQEELEVLRVCEVWGWVLDRWNQRNRGGSAT